MDADHSWDSHVGALCGMAFPKLVALEAGSLLAAPSIGAKMGRFLTRPGTTCTSTLGSRHSAQCLSTYSDSYAYSHFVVHNLVGLRISP